MSFQQVAQQLAGYTNIGFNNAVRIARTEGHRVQCQSGMDACYKARDRGAEVAKQWDAALDARTRDSHAKVDGEIRELDKPFSNGLMFPGDPSGPAAEVINCRCALNQRGRWALEGGFTKMNNFTKELESFESPEEYAEFKEAFFSKENRKYMNYVGQMEEKYDTKNFAKVLDKMDEREYNHYSKLLEKNPVYNKLTENDISDIIDATNGFVPAKTIEEAANFASDVLHLDQTTAYRIGMNVDVANGLNEAIYRIGEEFTSLTEAGYLENVLFLEKMDAYAAYQKSLHSLFMNKACKRKNAISVMGKDAKGNFDLGFWSSGNAMHSVYHELGHATGHMILDNDAAKQSKIEALYNKLFHDVMGNAQWSMDDPDLVSNGKKAQQMGLSYYGLRNSSEFVSESIARYYLSSDPSDIAKKVIEILKGK